MKLFQLCLFHYLKEFSRYNTESNPILTLRISEHRMAIAEQILGPLQRMFRRFTPNYLLHGFSGPYFPLWLLILPVFGLFPPAISPFCLFVCTESWSHWRAKLCDWAVWPVRAGCYSWAALSLFDSNTLYRHSTRKQVCSNHKLTEYPKTMLWAFEKYALSLLEVSQRILAASLVLVVHALLDTAVSAL